MESFVLVSKAGWVNDDSFPHTTIFESFIVIVHIQLLKEWLDLLVTQPDLLGKLG